MRLFFITVLTFFAAWSLSQSTHHSVYLIGNSAEQNDAWVKPLIKDINQNKHTTSVYFLGDITDNNGIKNKPKKENEDRLKSYKKLEKKTDTNLYFLSGDRDWDNSGPNGKKKVRHLESYIEQNLKLKKSFIPSRACPGPYVINDDEHTLVVAINSQWFIHPHERPEAPDTDCSILYESDFWEELEDVLDDSQNKNILVLAHHPIYSTGPHNGKKLGKFHRIPIIGTLYGSFKKNIGTPRDFAHPAYQHYIHKMRNIISDHQSVIYVSGHDFHNTILQEGGNYFINTSLAKHSDKIADKNKFTYSSKNSAVTRIDFKDDGQVIANMMEFKKDSFSKTAHTLLHSCKEVSPNVLINQLFNTCHDKLLPYTEPLENANLTQKNIVAGPEYKANRWTKKIMGSNYRSEWTLPVDVEVLDLKNTYRGLRPYARGGGLQTNSLKFKAGDGQRYVFRAVNKNPERALDELTKQTIYRKVIKQLITTQHPYGGLAASYLLDQTDILHARPRLYTMPDDPSLGIYREDFAGKMGFLEIKPKTKKKKTFGGADAIVSTHQMLRSMNKSHDHQIDKMAYAKARVFDMWVGDWDRHEDNWKWAAYKKKKKHIYRPIPRDRDHVFSKWEGVIPSLADRFIPNAENFDYSFGNLTQLNFKASHLDRLLATELTLEDWMHAVEYIVSLMTDDIIQNALKQFPQQLELEHSEEIIAKLKSRKSELKETVKKHFENLEKQISIIGSNEDELFDVKRLNDDQVIVQVYHLSKKDNIKDLLYVKTFSCKTTEEIYLFGLAGNDHFIINGSVNNSIKVRVIPGDDEDVIEDYSSVKGGSKMTQVYLRPHEKFKEKKSKETRIKKPSKKVTYDYFGYQLDELIPLPGILYSGSNGFGLVLDVDYRIKGFNKPNYAKKHDFKIKYYPQLNAVRLDYDFRFRHFWKTWDFHSFTRFSNRFDRYPRFYGLGSNTTWDENLNEQDYFDIVFKTFHLQTGMIKDFLRKSSLTFNLNYRYNDVFKNDKDKLSILDEPKFQTLKGVGINQSLDLESALFLDFRDNPKSTYQGSLLEINHKLIYSISGNDIGGNLNYLFSHYETIKLLKPITFVGRVGMTHTYGEIPFYDRAILGYNTYVRGFERNRFIGDQQGVLNLEVRLQLGTWYNVLSPITFGIFGFSDTGKVWNNDEEFNFNNLRKSYGLGIYAAPYQRDYSITLSYALNDEDYGFLDLKLGFDLQ